MFFTAAAAALAVTLGVGLAGLPSFGSQIPPTPVCSTTWSRAAARTDAVSAISFDYRGIDTLFEEFILFAAVTGISVLLRPLANEIRQMPRTRRRTVDPAAQPGCGAAGVFLSPLLVVTALETVTHGQVSPGGGFQGGVVLASAVFVVYLATSYSAAERFEPEA